jgi:hypothetical protein
MNTSNLLWSEIQHVRPNPDFSPTGGRFYYAGHRQSVCQPAWPSKASHYSVEPAPGRLSTKLWSHWQEVGKLRCIEWAWQEMSCISSHCAHYLPRLAKTNQARVSGSSHCAHYLCHPFQVPAYSTRDVGTWFCTMSLFLNLEQQVNLLLRRTGRI